MTVTDFLWSGGKLSGAGTTTVTGTMTITDGRHRIDGRTLESLGTATLSGSRNDLIELENDAVFTNRGQFDVQQDTIININGLGPGGTGEFRNEGSMVFTGPGTTNVGSIGTVTFNNTGSVDVQSGTVTFGDGYTQTETSAVTTLNSSSIAGIIDIAAGKFSGTGTVTGSVQSGGQVLPGLDIGAITVTQNYEQASSGVLEIEIDGPIAGNDYDQLVVSGNVTLSGGLSVGLRSGSTFVPSVGDTFTIIKNLGMAPVGDTFDGLPEGDIVDGGTIFFEISYLVVPRSLAVPGMTSY